MGATEGFRVCEAERGTWGSDGRGYEQVSSGCPVATLLLHSVWTGHGTEMRCLVSKNEDEEKKGRTHRSESVVAADEQYRSASNGHFIRRNIRGIQY